MKSVDLQDADVILTDGDENLVFTNKVPRKYPKTKKQRETASRRAKIVGGMARTARARKKAATARKRASVLVTPFQGTLSWTEGSGTTQDESIDVHIDFEYEREVV